TSTRWFCPGTYFVPVEPIPPTSPNGAPFFVVHCAPSGPSTTYGIRSFMSAEAFDVKRSGGSQGMSIWQSAEIRVECMLPSCRAGSVSSAEAMLVPERALGKRRLERLHSTVMERSTPRRRASETAVVGVIADTHGLLRPQALAALAGVDLIVHAGDI